MTVFQCQLLHPGQVDGGMKRNLGDHCDLNARHLPGIPDCDRPHCCVSRFENAQHLSPESWFGALGSAIPIVRLVCPEQPHIQHLQKMAQMHRKPKGNTICRPHLVQYLLSVCAIRDYPSGGRWGVSDLFVPWEASMHTVQSLPVDTLDPFMTGVPPGLCSEHRNRRR
jgi:hypothetical protein